MKPGGRASPNRRPGLTQPPTITRDQARTLLLSGHGLLRDPARRTRSQPRHALDAIRELGFVQVDSINVVERAHHHILWTRDHAYRPAHLDALQKDLHVFEHWTHDASVIPIEHFHHWHHRFERVAWSTWFNGQLGRDREALLASVKAEIEARGPLMARHFEHPSGAKSGGWWEWKPAKAALEYLWRRGELTIVRREGFQKVYDLTPRAMPQISARPASDAADHVAWACTTAIERLGVATPTEIAKFWNAVPIADARRWCAQAVEAGSLVSVVIESDHAAKPAVARPDWRAVLEKSPDAPPIARLLSPFDPIMRDRARALRLFNFDYRFEAFVPERLRTYGYYVLPVLAGDRIIARVDAAADRSASLLVIKGVWWEPGTTARAGWKLLGPALDSYVRFVGVDRWALAARVAPFRAATTLRR